MKCVTTDLICMNQHHESISLTAGIFLINKEVVDQLWCIRNKVFKIPTKRKIIYCLSMA